MIRAIAPKAIAAARCFDPDDLTQDLLDALVVGEPDDTGTVGQFRGTGPLSAWVRTCAMRQCLMRRRRRGRAESIPDELPAVADSGSDPELARLKGTHRSAFDAALREAFASLDSQQRNLMRLHYIDGLQQRGLAAMYGVHPATMSRRFAAARQQILEESRRALKAKGVAASDAWELAQSQLE
ncbi:MAG: sigma-70 family RNA polymerase sigma factor [Nannocystales bacterium]